MPRLIEFEGHILDATQITGIGHCLSSRQVSLIVGGTVISIHVPNADNNELYKKMQQLKQQVWPGLKTDLEIREEAVSWDGAHVMALEYKSICELLDVRFSSEKSADVFTPNGFVVRFNLDNPPTFEELIKAEGCLTKQNVPATENKNIALDEETWAQFSKMCSVLPVPELE